MGEQLTAVEVQDAFNILSAYQKGLTSATTEESGFAFLALRTKQQRQEIKANKLSVQNVRGDFLEAAKAKLAAQDLSKLKNYGISDVDLKKVLGDKVDDQAILQAIAPALSKGDQDGLDEDRDFFDKIKLEDCIPCLDRLKEFLNFSFVSDLGIDLIDAFLKDIEEKFDSIVYAIKLLLDQRVYLDICNLIKFLVDFVCLPDLTKIISLLTFHLASYRFDLDGMLSILLGILNPLFSGIFLNLASVIIMWLNALKDIIRCVINAIITQADKVGGGLASVMDAIAEGKFWDEDADEHQLMPIASDVAYNETLANLRNTALGDLENAFMIMAKKIADAADSVDAKIRELWQSILDLIKKGKSTQVDFLQYLQNRMMIARLLELLIFIVENMATGDWKLKCNTEDEIRSHADKFLNDVIGYEIAEELENGDKRYRRKVDSKVMKRVQELQGEIGLISSNISKDAKKEADKVASPTSLIISPDCFNRGLDPSESVQLARVLEELDGFREGIS